MQPVNITKDGVTVARSLTRYSTDCRLENIGAKLIIDAAERANEECGDGTTTTSLIAGFLMREGSKLLVGDSRLNSVELRKGMMTTVETLCKILHKMAIPIESTSDQRLRDVALISSNNDSELADMISEVYCKVGKDGTISIQEG
jgi:chaperonin GroEL